MKADRLTDAVAYLARALAKQKANEFVGISGVPDGKDRTLYQDDGLGGVMPAGTLYQSAYMGAVDELCSGKLSPEVIVAIADNHRR